MAASKAVKTLGLYKKYTQLEKGIGVNLPEAYKKFYNEWKSEPTAVHYIPQNSNWNYNQAINTVLPVQNVPLPLKYPSEFDNQLWGGEAIIQGFTKTKHYNRRNPTFWLPTLHRSVIYSEVLNKHISVVVTERALQLIHSNYGFDHYVLKTPACDLKSVLALKLKRRILQELENGCPSHSDKEEKQKEVVEKYQQYLTAYTSEEIEWYGYTFQEACDKWKIILENQNKVFPLKDIYRAELVQKLQLAREAEKESAEPAAVLGPTAWLKKLNPFSKQDT